MVPVSCCLSATGLGLSGHPVPARELGLPHGRLTGPQARTRTGFPRSAPARYDRDGCLLDPGDGGALPNRMPCPASACRFPAASPCTPHSHPIAGLLITRHQRRFTRFIRPACSSPVIPGWDGNPRAFPCAPHPAVTGDARQGGAGREHAPATTRPT